ncbi:MAG TPA: 50S ribosomal protein L18 [candidate division Zixibacteria bacterium]|jgi:large subunit ribosomal protein L18
MADKMKFKKLSWERRQRRVRKKVKGTEMRPRLCIYKSLRQIYAQVIDDVSGRTILGTSSLNPEVKKLLGEKDKKTELGKKVGLYLAQLAKAKGIEEVVFDRNRYRYHGRVKALAEGAREGGLKF